MFGMLGRVPRPPDAPERILDLAREALSEGEAERLVSWLAARQGRPQALAGDRPTLERLEHVVRHWLTPAQAERLAGWMSRRLDDGKPPVPARPPRARSSGAWP